VPQDACPPTAPAPDRRPGSAPRRPAGGARATPAEPIRSPANPAIALVRALLAKREARAGEGAFVVEGRRAVADALAAGARPRLVLLRAGTDPGLPAADLPLRPVEPRLFDRLSDVAAPQGILAVFPTPRPAAAAGATPLALVLDRLRDPGNLGTLLRAAAAAGATAVYLSPTTVDPFNPKAVRAGMGAHFRLPLHALDDPAVADLRAGYPLRAVARAGAAAPYDAVDWRGPAVLIVGAEADGVSPEVAALGTVDVAVPLAPGVESLNAAVAGAILLFEAARQRRSG